MINYVFVSSNLVNAIVDCSVADIMNHFDTDHIAVSVFVGLDGLLNVRLNLLCKQVNKNHWKFDVKNTNDAKRCEFIASMAANAAMFLDDFSLANIICKIMILLANITFKKKWFKDFEDVFTKVSFRFHKLKLLVSKLVKALCSNRLDSAGTSAVRSLFLSGSNFGFICSALAKTRKLYCFSKLLESRCTEKSSIKQAINKKMENFKLDKDHTIRSVLEHFFCKVVLDYLVVDDELVLEPKLVKSKVDVIIERWTKKHGVPLDYIFDGAFSNIMSSIGFDKMFTVVSNLSDRKAAVSFRYAFGIWFVSVLINTYLIALIETAHKIFSKILLDRIFLACSTFDILCRDNFSVLKGTSIQSLIFAVDSVIEDALEKNQELCVNRVMTDFGLTDGYHVYDSLDQGERIFYDLLLCEVKKQESMCGYRLNSYFVSKNSQAESQAGLTSFFAVGSSQAATQHILDVAGEFFRFNDISINNDKTVVIPINYWIASPHLTISNIPIFIAKKDESYCYLGIFLSTEGLSKPSLAKTHLDVRFFVNFVLRKTILNKQFAYLVLAVLFPIIGYRTQFSYVHLSVCNKWDALIRKCLKSKSGLSHDFLSDVLYHPSLYNLKSFEQIQAESKSASTVFFANSTSILDWLFSHRSHDLQFLAHVRVDSLDNFLAGMVRIFSGYDLSLGGSLVSAFCLYGGTLLSFVLGEPNSVVFDWKTFKCWKWLDLHDSSDEFGIVSNSLLSVDASYLSVYIDESLSGLETLGMKAGAAVFFEDVDLGLSVEVFGLVFSTMTELQAIALALECVLLFCHVDLFLDSQAALDACKMESLLICPDFRNQCWIKHCHILNVIHHKNLVVNWVKVKDHSGVLSNEHADKLAKNAVFSDWFLPHLVGKCFLKAGGTAISGNSRHFVHNVFKSIMVGSLRADIDWYRSSLVWHPNSHLAAGFTSMWTVGFQMYFMKVLHYQLSVAICKQLYDKCYPSVVCLFCGDVEVSDHIFSCFFNAAIRAWLLDAYASAWLVHSGLSRSFLCIVQLLAICAADMKVGSALYKGFVLNE
ncbi:hypothetical protein G9A89_005945 [Geosiphon pyriformis]|nr:hypothetical protein G9A89_005945 [Geosiphon pyriformis]